MVRNACPSRRRAGLAGVIVLLLAGCSVVGPTSIRAGRGVYNEAIAATNDEQILTIIVKNRFSQSASLLTVSSITANVSVSGRVGADVGFGPDDNYSGNLVPLSVGAAYEENPTVSYVPLNGEAYMRELLTPLPLDLTLLLMLNVTGNAGDLLTMLVRGINGIPNPDFQFEAETPPDPRFARIAELMTELHLAGRLTWTATDDGSYAFVLHGYQPDYVAQVDEIGRLLGLGRIRAQAGVLTVPVALGVGAAEDRILLETRSIFRLISIAAAATELSEADRESGEALPTAPMGPVGSLIRIRWSRRAPAAALVAIRSRGGWHYIDATDTSSKNYFRVLEALISYRIADTVDRGKSTPVLTVPVSN